ncbi:MAG TPA: BatA domain-containing protein, partial [Sumerlaeia bacterium]|nr:BatA domain-containing protein [Sumerlaeia bacterium]
MNPIFWVAASALAGPALLHLLLRNRPKRRVLPTLRFLPVTSQQTMAMHRLKNILLLILRLLILLLIVAAFTRPYLKRRGTARENAETVDEGAVFAVDTSLSMRVGNRWRVAVNRAGT